MSLAALFGAVAAAVARRPWPVLVLLTVFAIASAAGLSGMKAQPVTDAFFDRSTEGFKATERAEATFGTDPIVVLARGDLSEIVTAKNLESMSVLETCLAGDISRGRGRLFESCERLAELQPVQVLTGPASFLGRAVAGISRLYGQQIERLESLPDTPEAQVERQEILLLATRIIARYGLVSPPSLDDPEFVNRVVFGPGGVQDGPKPRLSYLFPSGDTAQVLLRLRSDLTDAERRETIELVRKVAADEATQLTTGPYVVSGSPAVFEGLGESIQIGVVILAVAALILMSIALTLVFGSTWRLLPLLMALTAVLISAGLLRLLGGELSLAALGAAPILIGLSVDYAVQIQARYDEMGEGVDPAEAARNAARLGLPMIATACLATALGFASLGLSRFPLVSEFGLLLGAGVLICLFVTSLFGFAALSVRGPGRAGDVRVGRFGLMHSARDWAKSGMALAILAPSRLLLVSMLIAVCGWAVSTQGTAATEVGQLLPSRNSAVEDLEKLEDATGSSGVIDLVVRADDVTNPAVVGWLDRVRTEVGLRSGYQRGDEFRCEGADLCPGPSIPDFVPDGGEGLGSKQIRKALLTLPPNERAAIIAGGLEGDQAASETKIPFIVRSESVSGQADSIKLVRDVVESSNGGAGPPPGVTAELAGLPVVVTESVDALAASRYLLILAALAAVALVLLVVYRAPRRVIVPLVPIVVAGGWSSLTVASLDLPLNPLSAILSVMVLAIATEFSVILAARYYQDRARGLAPASALRLAYGRTGMAIAASGITAIAGFAALVTSDVGILRNFGLIAVLDLGVALLGVALVLPAVLVWMERR